jgi:hypothetical protein
MKDETLAGKIVLTVGLLGHAEGIDMNGPVKAMLDQLHLRKIDLADEVLVLNARLLTCSSCGKPCDSSFHPVGATGYSWSKCCQAAVGMVPYIGESTRNEINYATAKGKKILYLEPPV